MPRQVLSALGLSLALVLAVSAVQEPHGWSRADFPYIQTLHELDTEESKLEHLGNWHFRMASENGLSGMGAYRFRSLLDLWTLSHVDEQGTLDRRSLLRQLVASRAIHEPRQ